MLMFCLFLTAGCASPISKELRQEAARDLTFSMVLQRPEEYKGSTVIWGGYIIRTVNRVKGTEFYVLETPLGTRLKPEDREYSQGRFVARSSRYYDPKVYGRGRKVTIAGKVAGEQLGKVGELPYVYPLVQIEEMHLWRREPVWYPPPYSWDWGWNSPYYEPELDFQPPDDLKRY
jgi:outer membrane lipoprotein